MHGGAEGKGVRTFDVTVNGHLHVIRAHDFQRPDESLSGKWVFIDAQGRAVWSFNKEDLTAVVEGICVVSTT